MKLQIRYKHKVFYNPSTYVEFHTVYTNSLSVLCHWIRTVIPRKTYYILNVRNIICKLCQFSKTIN